MARARKQQKKQKPTTVFIIGAGKVGTALAKQLRPAGVKVTLRAARKGLPKAVRADVVVLAVRDRDLRPLAESLATVIDPKAVAVHVAGALGADVLAPLRGHCAGVAQMHPMISFASTRFVPALTRGNVHVQGDAPAVARAKKLAKLLGMTPRTIPNLDTVAYHAAAAFVANGAAALAALGVALLGKAGVRDRVAVEMLGPLLRSVADNVETLGFPAALTGPVRRGDAAGVEKHLRLLQEKLPEAVRFYLAAAEAQLPLARALGEAPAENIAAVARAVELATAQVRAPAP